VPGCRPAPGGGDRCGTVCHRKHRRQILRGHAVASQVGWFEVGEVIELQCSTHGQPVKGFFSFNIPNGGWDNLWYRTTSGHYVADVDIETGTLKSVTPDCSTLGGGPAPAPAPQAALAPAPAPAPQGSREDRAYAWTSGKSAREHIHFCVGGSWPMPTSLQDWVVSGHSIPVYQPVDRPTGRGTDLRPPSQ
jgi:hypothetical protein